MAKKQKILLTLILSVLNVNLIVCKEEAQTGSCIDKQRVERSLIMLKPDALKRGLVGESIKRFENGCKGCKLIAMKYVVPNETQIHLHYRAMKNEEWFDEMVEFMTSGPVIPMVWEGENMAAVGRELLHGVRKDYATTRIVVGHLLNIIHGADTEEDANREMKIWFTEQELADMEKESPNAYKFWPVDEACFSKSNRNKSS